jgi:hypothetical protein
VLTSNPQSGETATSDFGPRDQEGNKFKNLQLVYLLPIGKRLAICRHTGIGDTAKIRSG